MTDARDAFTHTIDDETVATLPRAGSCPFDPNGGLGPSSNVLQGAAYGGLIEQRTIRDAMTRKAFSAGLGHPFAIGHSMQMVLAARICAAHRLPDDARHLAAALCFTNDALRHHGYAAAADATAGELVALLEQLSDAGDEYCGIASAHIVAVRPATAAIAHALMKGKL